MTERDRPAVDVQSVRVGTQLFQPGLGHTRKGLVHFIQVDIFDAHPGLGQRAAGGVDRGLQHDHRVLTKHTHVMDAGQRRDAQRLQSTFADHHDARRAVTDLRGGCRRQPSGLADQADATDALQRGIKADALIGSVQLGGPIRRRDRHRHDLGPERPGLRRRPGPTLAFIAKGVQFVL